LRTLESKMTMHKCSHDLMKEAEKVSDNPWFRRTRYVLWNINAEKKRSDETNLHQHIFIRLPWTSHLQSWKLRACVLPIFTGRSYQAAFTAISTLRTGDDARMKCVTTKKNDMKFANYTWLGLFLPSKLLFLFRGGHFWTTVMGAIWLLILPPWLNSQYPLPTFLFDDRFTNWTLLIAWLAIAC
jgi:hypothetical protein